MRYQWRVPRQLYLSLVPSQRSLYDLSRNHHTMRWPLSHKPPMPSCLLRHSASHGTPDTAGLRSSAQFRQVSSGSHHIAKRSRHSLSSAISSSSSHSVPHGHGSASARSGSSTVSHGFRPRYFMQPIGSWSTNATPGASSPRSSRRGSCSA